MLTLPWVFLSIWIFTFILGTYVVLSDKYSSKRQRALITKLKPKRRSETSVDSLEILNIGMESCTRCNDLTNKTESKHRWLNSRSSILNNQD